MERLGSSARASEVSEPHLRLVESPKPLSHRAALAQLRRLGGRINVSALARDWNWPRSRVSRQVKLWTETGKLSPRTQPPVRKNGPLAITGSPPPSDRENQFLGGRATWVSVSSGLSYAPALALAAIALTISWFGLRINAWYGATLGRTAEAGFLLAGLSITADLLALLLPAIGRSLWLARCRVASVMAWCLWSVTLAVTLLATIGFASVNISDTMTARSRLATESAALAARLASLRQERAGVTEMRSVAAIEAEIQRAQPAAWSVWKRTAGCHDVTLPASGEACAEILKLRQALGAAQRRDALDLDLHESDLALSRLPAISTADPQTETAAKLLQWLTGSMAMGPADLQMARIAGMTLLPQLAGIVLMLAAAMGRPPRNSPRQMDLKRDGFASNRHPASGC